MKVVLFCGGLGTRLREHSDTIPKPLVNIGYRPIIWHLMKYYAYHGHKDFILCLGYRGDLIKEFFLEYNECISNDFTLRGGGSGIELHNSDIDDWTITFADTGLHSNLGQRLVAVKDYVADDEVFLANYSDGLSDLPLNRHIEGVLSHDATAGFVGVRTMQSFHAVHAVNGGMVEDFGLVRDSEFWVNGGFFVLKKNVFDYIEAGEEFVEQPFERMIKDRQLYVTKYGGFWQSMDTFRDKIMFDRGYARGNAPWEVWNHDDEARRAELMS
jgi:glucose-1-phosphate cytidylyltransferase